MDPNEVYIRLELTSGPVTLRIMIPVLTHECVVYAYADAHKSIDLAVVVWVCAYHSHPRQWWWPPLREPY